MNIELTEMERVLINEALDAYWEHVMNAHHPENEFEYAVSKSIKRKLKLEEL